MKCITTGLSASIKMSRKHPILNIILYSYTCIFTTFLYVLHVLMALWMIGWEKIVSNGKGEAVAEPSS